MGMSYQMRKVLAVEINARTGDAKLDRTIGRHASTLENAGFRAGVEATLLSYLRDVCSAPGAASRPQVTVPELCNLGRHDWRVRFWSAIPEIWPRFAS